PPASSEHPQTGCAPLPVRSRRAVHQQPGRTRWSDDEAAAEDLWRLSLRGRSGRIRGHPVVALDRQKARLGYAGDTHRQPTQPDLGPARRLIWPAKPGQLPYLYNYRPLPPGYYLPTLPPLAAGRPGRNAPGPTLRPNNCGTPDEPKPCPPLPRVPLPDYAANRGGRSRPSQRDRKRSPHLVVGAPPRRRILNA